MSSEPLQPGLRVPQLQPHVQLVRLLHAAHQRAAARGGVLRVLHLPRHRVPRVSVRSQVPTGAPIPNKLFYADMITDESFRCVVLFCLRFSGPFAYCLFSGYQGGSEFLGVHRRKDGQVPALSQGLLLQHHQLQGIQPLRDQPRRKTVREVHRGFL